MKALELLVKILMELESLTIAVIGLQHGDEGKGKVIDFLAQLYKKIVRFNGGHNAGHSVYRNNKLCHLHFIPSGILWPDKIAICAAGEIIELKALFNEIRYLKYVHDVEVKGRLWLDPRINLILPTHRALDKAKEIVRRRTTGKAIGTTAKGIGPTYSDSSNRQGVRIHQLLSPSWEKVVIRTIERHEKEIVKGMGLNDEELEQIFIELTQKEAEDYRELIELGQLAEELYDYTRYYDGNGGINAAEIIKDFRKLIVKLIEYQCVVDTFVEINKAISTGEGILFEGGQGACLDVWFGTWPYVTSSHTTVGGACVGAGIGPNRFGKIFGIAKAISTRVGEGPLPTEEKKFADRIRGVKGTPGAEFGTSTGRPRRLGPFDAVTVRTNAMLNGITDLALMKLDFLDNEEEVRICDYYELKGEKLFTLPADSDILDEVTPHYITLKGWKQPTSKIESWEDLPEEAKIYLAEIVRQINEVGPWHNDVQLRMVGVGPNREQMIVCN